MKQKTRHNGPWTVVRMAAALAGPVRAHANAP